MLVGMKKRSHGVRAWMEQNTRYRFYLTGSRYFGRAVTTSDWDFFVEDGTTIRLDLKGIGFKCISDATSYRDKLTVSVYRYEDEKIDVQIVKDAKLKYRAQQYIENFPLIWNKFSKHEMDALWDFAFAMVHDIPYSRGVVGSGPDLESMAAQRAKDRSQQRVQKTLGEFMLP